MLGLAKGLAYCGGFILVFLSVMTVISVVGRYLVGYGLSPIKGDFEMVEMGCAVAIFAFMPLAQMKRAHVTVDIFISALPSRAQCFLGLIGDILIAVVSYVMVWRFWLSFGEKFPYGSPGFRSALGMGSPPFFPESSYELEVEIWIPYGFALIGAAFFFVVSLYTVWRALNWTLDGQEPQL